MKQDAYFNGFMKELTKKQWVRTLKRDRYLILLAFPAVIILLLFSYLPMAGILMAFQNYKIKDGIFGSDFIGLRWFKEFFQSIHFSRLLYNTFCLSFLSLLVNMPIAILFALQLNELRNGPFKKLVQSVSYFPYFISTVVVVGMLINFLNPVDGIVNRLLMTLNMPSVDFLNDPKYFRAIYVISGLWQSFGWNAIIYIGAISGIDPSLYEAATVDGSTRIQKVWYITFPCILPVIITVLLLSMGSLLNVGHEKIILMYAPTTYKTSDVISTYVYRMGIQGAQYSFAAAVGLFNSVVNMAFILIANMISKKVSGVYLW